MEADVAGFVVADDASGADGTALHVAGEVADGGFAGAGVLELDVPGFGGLEGGFGGGGQLLENFGVVGLEGLAQVGLEAFGEGAVVDEEVFVAGADGLLFLGMPCECGNDAVDVGVVLELATPGVEHAGKSAGSAFGFGGDDVAQGGGAGFQDEVIHFPGMGEAGLAQLAG